MGAVELLEALGPAGCATLLACRDQARRPFSFEQISSLLARDGHGQVGPGELEQLWGVLEGLPFLL